MVKPMDENEKNRLSSLAYWFPIVSTLGIPVPKTTVIPCVWEELISPEFIAKLELEADSFGYPVFMRTDLSSGKHDWKNTCYVPNRSAIVHNLVLLDEYNTIGRFGYTSIVLREFLRLETAFVAFPGDMPINKERRYFIRDGMVVCHHPYWPQKSFNETELSMYGRKLALLNHEEQDEITLLTSYSEKVASVLPGYWSIDFAKTEDGVWYLIDMAVGEFSYHMKPCEAIL
jgi:hypothetical protein